MKYICTLLLVTCFVVLHADACKRMTAALGTPNGNFLFFGNTYVTLDNDYKQDTIPTEGNVPGYFHVYYPDAVFRFARNGMHFFFSDKYYFYSGNNYEVPLEAKEFGGNMTRFFDNGLDAASNLYGKTVFFKGCKYFADTRNGPTAEFDLPHEACDPDAAMATPSGQIMLFKDDLMWVMDEEDNQTFVFSKPTATHDVLHLKDVLCSKGEKEE